MAAVNIDARGLHYRELNRILRESVLRGAKEISLHNVAGQRYIGTNLGRPVKVRIYGTPGNDLGAFMDGPQIEVYGNAQDGVGNTMNSGQVVVHGGGGDIVGMSMRGGKIFIKGDVGYRCAIHMKEYEDKKPVLVIGGTAHDFLGEYMAGGIVVLLGIDLEDGQPHPGRFIGTGMHGGAIFLRGRVEEFQLGKGVKLSEITEEDEALLDNIVDDFCQHFGYDPGEILSSSPFIKLTPKSLRPFEELYSAPARLHKGSGPA